MTLFDDELEPTADLGRVLKEAGQESVLEHSGEWKHAAADAIALLADERDTFTSEDVVEIAGPPPHPNAVGAAINAAANRGEITRLRYEPAKRAISHGAVIGVWTRKDR